MKKLKYTGFIILVVGIICLLIKACSTEYIDSEGFLHEWFFLLPIGFLFISIAIIIFLIIGIKKIVKKNKTIDSPLRG